MSGFEVGDSVELVLKGVETGLEMIVNCVDGDYVECFWLSEIPPPAKPGSSGGEKQKYLQSFRFHKTFLGASCPPVLNGSKSLIA